MADTAAAKPKSGPVGGLTRKLGPLPVWAWAIIGLAVGYFVYEHYLKGASTPATSAATANPVPGSDQSVGGASTTGGIGSTTTTPPTNPLPNPQNPNPQNPEPVAGTTPQPRVSDNLAGGGAPASGKVSDNLSGAAATGAFGYPPTGTGSGVRVFGGTLTQ